VENGVMFARLRMRGAAERMRHKRYVPSNGGADEQITLSKCVAHNKNINRKIHSQCRMALCFLITFSQSVVSGHVHEFFWGSMC
jgi:hypothetical protein